MSACAATLELAVEVDPIGVEAMGLAMLPRYSMTGQPPAQQEKKHRRLGDCVQGQAEAAWRAKDLHSAA